MKMRAPRLLTRWARITASIAALFFLSAGTLRIASLRNYLVAFSFLLLVAMLAVDPGLAQERAKPKDPATDESRLAAGLLFLLTLAVAGFSVGHCRQAFNTPRAIRHLALGVFLLSGAFQTWAMMVNPFFSPVVRLQTERGHRVIADGPYRFMRHPAISP
jgi:protein-S-isoprenylcysteine O-methyltransferase Ste14